MNSQNLTDLITQMLLMTVQLSLPILGAALVLGLIVSIFQAATQINEATLSFLPKIAGIIVVIIFISPWMIRKMSDYTRDVYQKIPVISRSR